jgi:hypothetical protein
MNNKFEFQIVCIDCGCLAIRIEDPVYSSRDAIVYCGDCGGSRGTLGDLRDLAVQTNTEVTLPSRSRLPFRSGLTTDDPQSAGEISERYGELQRLRWQVKMAESLAAIRGNQIRAADNTPRKKIPRSGHSGLPQRQLRSAGAIPHATSELAGGPSTRPVSG